MAKHRLQTELWLPQTVEEVFKFFADPGNLQRITPPWLRFEILNPKCAPVTAGTILDYRVRLRGIPLRWRSEITVWEPPTRFVDTQIKGPYSLWIHEHTFVEFSGGTVAGDKVTYAVPGGRIVNKLLVAPDLARIFQYRHEVLQNLFNPERVQPLHSGDHHGGPNGDCREVKRF